MNKVHYSSNKMDWQTPLEVFSLLDLEFHFDLDAAATEANALCANYMTPELDALQQDWSSYNNVFVNPPYGRGIGNWIRKSYEESLKGTTVVMLIPARPDTNCWHEYIFPNAEVRFLKGRLKFSGHKVNAPFPSAVVIFRCKK